MFCIPVDIRPTIIKIAPIVRELDRRSEDFFIVHTGQLISLKSKDLVTSMVSKIAKFLPMSYKTNDIFFEQLKLPDPKYNLNIGSGTHAEQISRASVGLEKILTKENPYCVLIHGDANMVPAASFVSTRLGIPAIHKEAGLRSYNRKMPEEFNRIIADHVCDYLFVPTDYTKKILIKEGIDRKKIFVTGNTIVDSVNYNMKIAEEIPLDLPDNFILLTAHRAENVDDLKVLKVLIKSIKMMSGKFDVPIIWPIHPRAKFRLIRKRLYFSLKKDKNLKIINPLGYFEFLNYLKNCNIVITDSGGIQEEACTLRTPCVTFRSETERPESVMVGANIVAGVKSPQKVLNAVNKMMNNKRDWKNPFGDGKASKRIVDLMIRLTK